MFGKTFCCILSVMVLVYFDHAVPAVPPPQTQDSSGHSLFGEGDLRYLAARIVSRPLELKADSMMQDSSPKKHKERDLSRYDKAGPYSLKLSLDARTRATMLATLRQFIWEHWSKRTLGHVVSTFYSKEGEPITYSFFIEANEKGNSCVAVEVDRLFVTRGESKKRYSQMYAFEVNTVQRIEVLRDGIRTIPEEVPREPVSFKLRLIDDRGNVRLEI